MATIEELRVGCLELRVWLRTAQDHGGVAVKKLADATAQLEALKAMEEQLADGGGDGGAAWSTRTSSSQEGTDSALRQRAEDAELALVRAEAEIARLTRQAST